MIGRTFRPDFDNLIWKNVDDLRQVMNAFGRWRGCGAENVCDRGGDNAAVPHG